MGLFSRRTKPPGEKRRSIDADTVGVIIPQHGERLLPPGYHGLLEAPEVAACIWRVADMIGSLPLHIRRNEKSGDVRVDDALARFVDRTPWSCGTRQLWVSWIAATEMAEGEAFVLPQTAGSVFTDLPPMPGAKSVRGADKLHYLVEWEGQQLDPDNVLHFRLRPDPKYPWRGMGPSIALDTVVQSLMTTAATKTAYMGSDYKPPIIVSVDADVEELADPDKRQAFLEDYVRPKLPGSPWVIPGGMVNVSQVRPLSLTDLAIRDGVELDKLAVAAIFGVPPFLLGVGSFNASEYNTFLRTVVLPLCRSIEQELTRKMLLAEDRYFRFNTRSLFAYDLSTLAAIADDQYVRGLMTGNEVRDWLDLDPKKDLDELVMLENYIPASAIGDQKKLVQTGEEKEAEA